MNQGFEVYDAEMQDRELNRKHWPERVAERTTDAAIALLKDRSEAPLFLWVHYQDPHGPYTPPARFAAQFRVEEPPRELEANASLSGIGGIPSYQLIGDQRNYHEYVSRYDGEIRYVDTHLQRLIDAIRERGLYDDALIVFTADHGEAMGERNFFFAHGSYLYNNLIHVPLIVKHGDRLSGRRSDVCQLIDVVPTILTLLGLDLDPRLRGRDLLDEQASSSPIYAETRAPVEKDGRKFSLLLDGFKLIHVPEYETYELFDLSSDPGEEHNLASDPTYAARLRDLLARLEGVRADDRLGMARQTPPLLTDEEREKLRSLGYLE